ncbi:MAG: hypothetical protein SGJ27_27590 [Candidatus Melainabacteria bacterium]|nr:hypothetical protein [Candidatus Melainabacteria bacterium]
MIDLNEFNKGESGRDGESVHGELEEGVASKILRETQMVSGGIGGAFLDVAKNPVEKAPELAVAAGFGVGLKVLQKAGAKGQVIASAVGLGMAGKMAYDEYMGDRWTTFGAALNDNWQSSANFERNLIATKGSVGALAVDSTVSMMGFKAAGSQAGKRVLNGEIGSKVPLRVSIDAPPRHSWLKGIPESPVNPVLLAEIRGAAHGKLIGNSLFEAQTRGGHSSTSFLDSLDVKARIDRALLQGTKGAAGQHLAKFEAPVPKPLETSSGIGRAPSHLEVPPESLASLNRFSNEMYEGLSNRIKGPSAVTDAGLLAGRADGGHFNASLVESLHSRRQLDPALLEGIKSTSKVEAPLTKPLETRSGIGDGSTHMEIPVEGSASLNRFSNEIYEGLNNIIRNGDSRLGAPAADAAVGGLPRSNHRWIPPHETVNTFRTSYPTVVEPLQGADAVVSLTSQGTVSSLALSKSLTSPGAAARVHAIVGYAELASTEPAAFDAALASTLLGRVGLAGRTTNTKAALKGAEAYINGAKGNSFTAFLSDRYGSF